MIGSGDGFERGAKTGGQPEYARAEKVLNDIISSWIPDREIVSSARITVEPFTAQAGFFPDTVISLAKMVQDSFCVPAAVTLAQWALESGFGKNGIGDHNYFGHHYVSVKSYMPHPAYIVAYDRKQRPDGTWKRIPVRYAKYGSIEECFMVHGEYLAGSDYYRGAFRAQTTRGFIKELSKHYAEDPKYAMKLLAIIDLYNLEGITK